MLTYRRRGLAQIHVAVSALVAVGFFGLMAWLLPLIRGMDLDPTVNLPLFMLVATVGMIAAGRFVTSYGPRIAALSWLDAAQLAFRQIVIVALAIFTLMVATKEASLSRLLLASYLVLGFFLLILVNHFVPRQLAAAFFDGANQCRTLFVGRAGSLRRLKGWIHHERMMGMVPVGWLCDQYEEGGEAWGSGGYLGPVGRLAEMMEAKRVNQVVLLDLPPSGDEVKRVFELCQNSGCRMMIYDNLADRFPVHMSPVIEGRHLFLTARTEPLEDPFNRGLKRVLDIAIALPVCLIFLPPLTLFVWLVQRFQAPGPVFFVRPRGGHNRTEFLMLKFRSMYEQGTDAAREAVQAKKGDSRIYPFGRFLRSSSLDEFPQFWNVLVGDMSLVGPRPHLPTHDFEFSKIAKAYRTRHLVKPGITGLAQVSGFRGEITDPALLQRRVDKDLQYITTWSIWMDIKIITMTILHVFRPPSGAY